MSYENRRENRSRGTVEIDESGKPYGIPMAIRQVSCSRLSVGDMIVKRHPSIQHGELPLYRSERSPCRDLIRPELSMR